MQPEPKRNARILAIDDSLSELHLLDAILRRAGYANIQICSDPSVATDTCTRFSPDIILLDLHMPVVSGFDVLEALADIIRAEEYLPVLVLTGDVAREARERALRLGARDFVAKPFDTTEVLLRIANLLETRSLHEASKELLKDTLTGVVSALLELLIAAHPYLRPRVSHLRAAVTQLCLSLRVEDAWEVELAAMLSHVGCLALPPATLQRVLEGRELLPEESRAYAEHPAVGAALLERIPRLGAVARIVRWQATRFADAPQDAPLGAAILKAALDYDALVATGLAGSSAVLRMKSRPGWYHPRVLAAFAQIADVAA